MNEVLFSSAKHDWETPQGLFETLNREFDFDLDVAASAENAKCETYFTEQTDGLSQEWAGVCWCNPPYSHIAQWVEKAFCESVRGVTTVMLIPARTDTRWFHKYIYNRAEIRFLKGRLKFSGSKNSAPFPSMIVIFRGLGL